MAPLIPFGTDLKPFNISIGCSRLKIPNSLAQVSALADSKNPMKKASKKTLYLWVESNSNRFIALPYFWNIKRQTIVGNKLLLNTCTAFLFLSFK